MGAAVKKFRPGDKVVVPFTTSCSMFSLSSQLMLGDCYYCNQAYTSRCLKALNFGNPIMPGGQAEYFKLHLADTTLFHAPDDIPLNLMVMMTDILPTGYSTAMNARRLADEDRAESENGRMPKKGVCVVIGCGPVSAEYGEALIYRWGCVPSPPLVLSSKRSSLPISQYIVSRLPKDMVP